MQPGTIFRLNVLVSAVLGPVVAAYHVFHRSDTNASTVNYVPQSHNNGSECSLMLNLHHKMEQFLNLFHLFLHIHLVKKNM